MTNCRWVTCQGTLVLGELPAAKHILQMSSALLRREGMWSDVDTGPEANAP